MGIGRHRRAFWVVERCPIARLLTVVFLSSPLALSALAVELTTDAERTYREIRSSDDRRTQLMAERWYGLVRLQDWTDATGKYKTRAKYVEHDPDLAWVKLRVIQGQGANRVVKDVQVPVDRLNSAGQLRVRQIAFLQDKVREAVVAEQAAANDESASGPGAARQDEAYAEPDEMQNGHGRDRRDAAEDSQPAMGDRPPLPAVMPPVPGAGAVALGDSSPPGAILSGERPVSAASGESSSASKPVAPPHLPDNDPWRTSYDAFRSNLLRTPEGTLANRESWAGMNLLQSLAPPNQDVPYSSDEMDHAPTDALQPVEALVDVGEFVWDATISSQVGPKVSWADVFQLPPMVEPIRIEFMLDERGAGHWQLFQVGDRQQFIGRFVGFRGPSVWVAAIRFPDEPTAQVRYAEPRIEE